MAWPEWSLSRVLAERPRIRVNQVGYLPDGPKAATLVSDATSSLTFAVVDAAGNAVFTGMTTVWPERPEPTSGLSVHVLDFSALRVVAADLSVRCGSDRSHPFQIGPTAYAGLAEDALRFFLLQRSGAAITEEAAPGYGRPAGHVGVPPNTGDLAVPAWSGPDAERLYPGWAPEGTFDVSGGWYDAGDYGKYVTSGSIAVWQLLSALDLLDRLGPPDDLADAIRDECRWQLDWMLRMQVPAGSPLAGLVFHRVHGTEWSPLPGWAHDDPTRRMLHRPSTGATLHLAAVAAQAARLFRHHDPAYAGRLLSAARTAYAAAHDHPRLIAPEDQGQFGGGPYGDGQLEDDFYWAACELWLTTGEPTFKTAMTDSGCHRADSFDPGGFDYDRVAGPAQLDVALLDPSADQDHLRAAVTRAADALVDLQQRQPWGQPYAPPEGWAWGSNGRILNNLVVLGTAHLITGDDHFRRSVRSGVDYLFGRNALGQSYVTGYGRDDSRHLRSRLFGHDHDPSFPPAPRGAIAGGPNSTPHPGFYADPRLVGLPAQLCYLDEPTSEVTNDVCIRWNAPLVWVAAFVSRR